MRNLRRLLGFLQPYRARFALSILLAALTIAGDLVVPMLFGWTISKGLESGMMSRVVFFAALLVAAQGFKSLTNYLQWTVQQQVGQNVVRDVRDQVYARLQALPTSFYRGMPTGQIMSRVTGDVEAVQEYLGWGFVIQIMAAMSFIGTSVILFIMDPQLTAVLYTPLLVLLLLVRRFDRRIGPAWAEIEEQMGKLSAMLQENISGVRVVKAFAREKLEATRFTERNQVNRLSNLKRLKLEADTFPAMDLMVGLSFVLLAWYGGRQIINGQGDLGRFFAYQWYLWGIIWPVRFMGWLISMMRQAMAAAPRLFEILDAPLKIKSKPDAVRLDVLRGEIAFEDVHFAYEDEPDRWVLKGLNLRIRPGEVVAVMGGTGSGKSSLVNLIARFQDVTKGRVLIDGHDARDLDLADLRRHIGIVPQEPFLFSATVGENIAYGRPGAPLDDVTAAARLAQAHEFIVEMPDGYDTQIGERGVRLSGGQKQRLSLARAFLIDPAVFILDEATSAVDTRTEHEIQQALARVMEGRTSIVIAQRLSTIKHADRIVVLKDGVVAEEGTHEELLSLDGEYRHIYDLQYRESDELAAELEEYLRERAMASLGDLEGWHEKTVA